MRTVEQEVAAFNGMRPSAVAKALGCGSTHVIELVRAGELEAIDISLGKRPEYRIDRASLDDFLARRKVA